MDSCCDNCEEWFHGDCVNVTKAESKNIRSYYCAACIQENDKLVIVYKKPRAVGSHSQTKGDKKSSKPKKSDATPSTSSKQLSIHQKLVYCIPGRNIQLVSLFTSFLSFIFINSREDNNLCWSSDLKALKMGHVSILDPYLHLHLL